MGSSGEADQWWGTDFPCEAPRSPQGKAAYVPFQSRNFFWSDSVTGGPPERVEASLDRDPRTYPAQIY